MHNGSNRALPQWSQKWTILGILALLVSLALLLGGCAGGNGRSSSSSSDSPAESVSDTTNTVAHSTELPDGTLIMGVDDQGLPPSVWMDEYGQYHGYDVELAQEAAKRLGWELEIKAVPWDHILEAVNDGSIDCIWNGFTMNIGDRQSQVTCSAPMLKSYIYAVVDTDDYEGGISSLFDKRIAVGVGTTAQTVIMNNLAGLGDVTEENGKLRVTSGLTEAFQLLVQGEVDAVICDDFSADYYVNGTGLADGGITPSIQSGEESTSGLHIVMRGSQQASNQPLIIFTSYDAVGVKLGNQELASDITNALFSMYEDGTVASILEPYKVYGVNMDNWVLISLGATNIS